MNGQQAEPATLDNVAELVAATTRLMSQLRAGAGLAQSHVAASLHLGPSSVSRFESNSHGVPKLSMFLSVCDVLNVRPSEVLRLAEETIYPLGGAPWTVSPRDLLAAYIAAALTTVGDEELVPDPVPHSGPELVT